MRRLVVAALLVVFLAVGGYVAVSAWRSGGGDATPAPTAEGWQLILEERGTLLRGPCGRPPYAKCEVTRTIVEHAATVP